MKQFCFDTTSSDIHRKNEFLKEVYVLNSMNHPNIVKLIGCCSEGSERLLVYEYMPLGNLRECLSGEFVHPCTQYVCHMSSYHLDNTSIAKYKFSNDLNFVICTICFYVLHFALVI